MLLQTAILSRNVVSKPLVYRACAFAIVALASAFGAAGCERQQVDPQPKAASPEPAMPNIVFVLVDTLRADKIGAYGRTPSITPTIDSVAEEGVTFERPIAPAPWTQPSIASIFSSYNPSVHRVGCRVDKLSAPKRGAKRELMVFSDQFQTLAECLEAGGYVTSGVVANSVLQEQYGFAQGFDHYDIVDPGSGHAAPGDKLNEAALAWLRQRDTSKPFFLYLHYMDVHGPYNAGPQFVDDLLDAVEKNPNKRLLTPVEQSQLKYLDKLPPNCPNPQRHQPLTRFREYWVARYEAGIREFDHHLAGLRAKLSEMGLWDDTYVIITSDHGEALCEHELWSHGFSTHHSDLHVPLILRWPGTLPNGKWISGNVRLIDVMPTLLSQLSLKVPNGIQGISLAPLIDGQPLPEVLPALAECVKGGPRQQAIHLGHWKLIVTRERERKQLYNLYDDYAEQIDLSVREPERVETLGAVLQRQVQANDKLASNFVTRAVPITAEQLERLRALGYVGD